MRIALATGQPLRDLLTAPDVEIATWIELLNELNEVRRTR